MFFWTYFCLVLCSLVHKGVGQYRQACHSKSATWGTCQSRSRCYYILEKRGINNTADFVKESKSCGANSVCCLNPNSVELFRPPHCGQPGLFNRIVGGTEAQLGELPWQAALGFKDAYDRMAWRCGGALITNRHVLTAAHCFDTNAFRLRVLRFGSTVLLGNNTDGSPGIEIRPKIVTIHEDYYSETFRNDLAMILLRERINFNERIRPICLPLQGSILKADFERLGDKRVVVSGWGDTLNPHDVKVLRKVRLPVVRNETCRQYFKEGVEYEVQPEYQLCAGFAAGKKDACYGDSGGPLIFLSDNIYYLVGIVSEGFECALPKFPGIYTRITAYKDWIIDNL